MSMSIVQDSKNSQKVRFADGVERFYKPQAGYEARFEKDSEGTLLETHKYHEVCPPGRTMLVPNEFGNSELVHCSDLYLSTHPDAVLEKI